MFTLERKFAEEIIAHAREEFPRECCGLLAGPPGGEVTRLYRTRNADASVTRYRIEPQELFQIYKEVEAKGWELLAIYHSHTFTEAYPSAIDVGLAFWPDSVYLIVSLRDPAHPSLRAFRIVDDAIKEEELVFSEKP